MTPLLTLKEAGRMLAISPWTIRAYIRTGRLTPVRIGRAVRLEESELLKFIENSKHHEFMEPDKARLIPELNAKTMHSTGNAFNRRRRKCLRQNAP